MSQQIVCSRCGTVLRKVAGLHSDHEPPLVIDERGALLRCPRCGAENRYDPDGDAHAAGSSAGSATRPF